MPAIASMSINDGQATPVAHTFAPVSTTGALANWADRSPGKPAGFRTASHEVAGPSGPRITNKITMGFKFPVIETVNGVDTVTRYSSGQIILQLHPDSTLQERKDVLAYMTNFLSDASVKTSVENVEPFY